MHRAPRQYVRAALVVDEMPFGALRRTSRTMSAALIPVFDYQHCSPTNLDAVTSFGLELPHLTPEAALSGHLLVRGTTANRVRVCRPLFNSSNHELVLNSSVLIED